MKWGITVLQQVTATAQILSAMVLTRCCLMLLLCCIAGCSPAKKLTEHSRSSDTLSLFRRDSLVLTSLLRENEHIALNIQHITYSKPDSFGIQHIRSITTGTAVHNSETEKQAKLVSGSELTLEKRDSTITSKELIVTPDTHYRFLFFILFLLGSAMLLKRYGKQ